ncbi:hypothetical protein Poly51_11010 [Rubripirellula tenax]|uniref:Nudix hydrolase domain-containing protein n=1 Tax=Rubripirellula tenax TaxID=2528015 RepID=A0A5C6FIQ7_9BACT|nr:NUDIX domain-containing protein [Rubripirellula tenax]TWU60820.1 hypothetical protein Poly51_11010 [Rubripirellula tenax]
MNRIPPPTPPSDTSKADRRPADNFGRKRGVVGVIFRDERLLIIRRSLTVTAPGKLCLPGGTMELGEVEHETLVREMQEELAIDVDPVRLCWRSVTPWGTILAWWLARLDQDVTPVPYEPEVSEYFWMKPDELNSVNDVLPSLPAFVAAWRRGEIDLDH